jgi:two-component system cell cycle sensor histidine kinase/response regulator CckA
MTGGGGAPLIDRVRTPTVLLVEDDSTGYTEIHEQLEGMGWRLLKAGNETDACLIAELHSDPIDVIIIDEAMAKTDGPELVAAFRRLRPQARVICLSTYTEQLWRTNNALVPDLTYLHAPVDMTTLLATITALLVYSTQDLPSELLDSRRNRE